ncbi:hypothetical protein KA005_36755, partial [bacterium]|nr:hypothetical protein [bacterium]
PVVPTGLAQVPDFLCLFQDLQSPSNISLGLCRQASAPIDLAQLKEWSTEAQPIGITCSRPNRPVIFSVGFNHRQYIITAILS